MAETTGISWTNHTFNPWIGCQKVSAGCANCYAEKERITKIRESQTGLPLWGADSHRQMMADSTWEKPHTWNRKAQRDGTRHRVFCASLADIFEDNPQIVDERQRLFDVIRATPNLDWQILTKRPENVGRFLPNGYWGNVWLGTRGSTIDPSG